MNLHFINKLTSHDGFCTMIHYSVPWLLKCHKFIVDYIMNAHFCNMEWRCRILTTVIASFGFSDGSWSVTFCYVWGITFLGLSIEMQTVPAWLLVLQTFATREILGAVAWMWKNTIRSRTCESCKTIYTISLYHIGVVVSGYSWYSGCALDY